MRNARGERFAYELLSWQISSKDKNIPKQDLQIILNLPWNKVESQAEICL